MSTCFKIRFHHVHHTPAPARAMNPGSTPTKTAFGRAAIARRDTSLEGVQRRLLILVDGQKTVNDLSAYVRPGELEPALAHLLAQDLIIVAGQEVTLAHPVAPGFVAAAPQEVVRAATDVAAYVAVRQQAADFVHARLGVSGEPICQAMLRCENPMELRKLLRGVEIFVGDRLSADTAQAFARHFGSLLL